MKFAIDPPGVLVPSGPDFNAHWSAAPSNYGFTQGQVEAWVGGALNAAGYFSEVPIGVVHDPTEVVDQSVVFRTVADLPGNAIGTCYYPGNDGHPNDTAVPYVELKASWYGNLDLVNHEALHAFLYATHSPEGSVSIMEPMEDPGEEGFSATDITQIREFLGIEGTPPDGPPEALPARTYWHPLDLPHYITHRDLSGSEQVGVIVSVPNVREAGLELGNTLRAVYAPTLDSMEVSDWEPLGDGVSFGSSGLYEDYSVIPEGAKGPDGVYVGLQIKTHLPIDELSLGQAEIRIR